VICCNTGTSCMLLQTLESRWSEKITSMYQRISRSCHTRPTNTSRVWSTSFLSQHCLTNNSLTFDFSIFYLHYTLLVMWQLCHVFSVVTLTFFAASMMSAICKTGIQCGSKNCTAVISSNSQVSIIFNTKIHDLVFIWVNLLIHKMWLNLFGL